MSESVRVGSAVGAWIAALCLASNLSAATTSFDQFDMMSDFVLADIVVTDPLGYTCIREDQIDLAFHATGKGVRLPRTCLPEPCDAALSQVQLASLIGRPPFPSEWDDYFSRYADYCRKEIVPLAEEAEPMAEEPDDAVAFWTPLVATYPETAPIRAAMPQGPGRTPVARWSGGFPPGPGTPGIPFGPGPETVPQPPFSDPDPGPERKTVRVNETPRPLPEGDGERGTPPVPAVPLPGSLVLVLTGLACLSLGRRRAAAA